MALMSEAASTDEIPTMVSSTLFIGGVMAARSTHTLQHLGITHILCLCANDFGQTDSLLPDTFQYKNLSIDDHDDASIADIFDEAAEFIDNALNSGNSKVLVHCFEGISRSATVVLAYLMLRKNYTLFEAWNSLNSMHRRAEPNDGFAMALLELDEKLHGKVSMEWQFHVEVCPLCREEVGFTTKSLAWHVCLPKVT